MEFIRSLRLVWRHRLFRQLVSVRVATQGADGIVQVGMASYVLFSPQQQPDAWSIAGVLAITLLPFSILGPFVGIVLDRWSRRQIVVVTDSVRAVLALMMSGLVLTGVRSPAVQTAFMLCVLLAMSLNRFVLAGLSASLPHTVDPDEYLTASSVMPTIGPAGVMLGAAVAAGTRLSLGQIWPTYRADAVVFLLAFLGFCASVTLASRIGRRQLGPDVLRRGSAREVLVGLRATIGHLSHRRPAALGLITIGVQRVVFGVAMVGTILAYRNYFHTVDQVDEAMADLSIWAVATGAGFILSAALTPPMAARFGLRGWMIVVLGGAAVFQAFPGSVYTRPTLVAASFLLGLMAQSLKISVDTLVQAHVDDTYKGRTFVIYDMIFNAALVLAAVIAAVVLPENGVSVPMFLTLSVLYVVIALVFTARSRRIGSAVFDVGTEALLARPPAKTAADPA